MKNIEKNDKILIIGGTNILGQALFKHFKSQGFSNLLSEHDSGLNLCDQHNVKAFFKTHSPEYVFITYIKSGGLYAHLEYPADFIYTNLEVQNNIIHSAQQYGVKKLLFLGSSCVYPALCPQPMKEDYLYSGKLDKEIGAYAMAKLAGLKMCEAYCQQYGVSFISLIPATVYGPDDDFSEKTAHVLPALLAKFHRAKVNKEQKVIVWGSGKALREFIYVDDLVDACIFLLRRYDFPEPINVGYGQDLSIKELAQCIKTVVGFQGEIIFDTNKSDGVSQKLLDSGRLTSLGWSPKIDIQEGIRRTYAGYLESDNAKLALIKK